MQVPRSLRPLRHRPYARLWVGAFTSNIGTWMEMIGVGIYVTSATGQAKWTGLVAAAGFVPNAVVGPIGGALADRLPRRVLLLATTSAQTVLATVLTILVATHVATPALVTLVVLTSSCAGALGFPAFQAILPELVPLDDLPGAIALSSAQWNLGRVVGPLLAGIVISLGGYSWAFALNSLSFLAVIWAIAPLKLPPPIAHGGESIVGSIRDGLRFVRAEPGIRSVVIYFGINCLLAAPFIGLVPAVAAKVFDNEKVGTSVLVTAQGLGAVAMALALGGLIAHWGNRRVLLGVLVALPPALALYGLAPNLALAAVAIAIVGFFYLGALSSFTTIAQLRAPSAMRGRVLSVLGVMLGSLYPLGALVQGALGDAVGLRTVTVGSGVLMALALLAMRLREPRFAAALASPGPGELVRTDPDPRQNAPVIDDGENRNDPGT